MVVVNFQKNVEYKFSFHFSFIRTKSGNGGIGRHVILRW